MTARALELLRVLAVPLLVSLGLGCGPSAGTEGEPAAAAARDENPPPVREPRPQTERASSPARPERRAGPGKGEELVVAVRVHLSKSESFELLDTSMSEAEVEAMMAEVNEIWAPARIRFELDSVVREEALAAAAYAGHVAEVRAADRASKAGKRARGAKRAESGPPAAAGPSRADKKAAREATLPQDQRIASGIDVYVHRALISAGGVFSCPARVVVFGEYKAGPKAEKNPAAVLAHELGHALGLSHVPCAPEGNLMMTVCPERDPAKVGLRKAQIARAREVAATGEARTCAGYVEDEDEAP